MITDYFDESVVLLKRLLSWELDDILYFKSNERQDQEKAVGLTDQVKDKIRQWNAADDLLFRYFNQTFWRKIKKEGKGFYDDLEAFRRKREQVSRSCLTNTTILQRQYSKKYVKAVSLKQNLRTEIREQCERMTRSENSYLAQLRRKRLMRLSRLRAAAANKQKAEELISWDVADDLNYAPVYKNTAVEGRLSGNVERRDKRSGTREYYYRHKVSRQGRSRGVKAGMAVG